MRIVILTGAGVSAESGIRTFRDSGGLWEEHDIRDVATPEAFARDPDLVHRFYDARRKQVASAEPNAAHRALARLQMDLGDHVLIITQNVDDLHERAGSVDVVHMHGELLSALCSGCGERTPWAADLSHRPPCPACAERLLRPDIVWFGEFPYHMDRCWAALAEADLFAAIGTSGEVYPAAGFVEVAAAAGARTVELNLAPSSGRRFDEVHTGPATLTVPRWVDGLLS